MGGRPHIHRAAHFHAFTVPLAQNRRLHSPPLHQSPTGDGDFDRDKISGPRNWKIDPNSKKKRWRPLKDRPLKNNFGKCWYDEIHLCSKPGFVLIFICCHFHFVKLKLNLLILYAWLSWVFLDRILKFNVIY